MSLDEEMASIKRVWEPVRRKTGTTGCCSSFRWPALEPPCAPHCTGLAHLVEVLRSRRLDQMHRISALPIGPARGPILGQPVQASTPFALPQSAEDEVVIQYPLWINEPNATFSTWRLPPIPRKHLPRMFSLIKNESLGI